MPSTVISFIHYDSKKHTLRVGYVSGMVYDYKNVPEEVYRQMTQAYSKGTFLNRFIKGKYDFEKLD
ncbi:MAG: KTSC domain-containing protein [Chitinophagaceae bacterium]|nr:MAG: KTSC domain-containing protein [Chitinophagaceae bacterium]